MNRVKVCDYNDLKTSKKIPFLSNELNLLIIYTNDQVFAINNQCGHFGIKLNEGIIENETIKCIQHGIVFSLTTGQNINRKWEDCDIIKCYTVKIDNNDVYIEY